MYKDVLLANVMVLMVNKHFKMEQNLSYTFVFYLSQQKSLHILSGEYHYSLITVGAASRLHGYMTLQYVTHSICCKSDTDVCISDRCVIYNKLH